MIDYKPNAHAETGIHYVKGLHISRKAFKDFTMIKITVETEQGAHEINLYTQGSELAPVTTNMEVKLS